MRSRIFILTGALGGLLGFVLTELTLGQTIDSLTGSTDLAQVRDVATYFAVFGLSVGAALGVTEGLVQKQPFAAIYGLVLGALLGFGGGFLGGGGGQAVAELVPVRYERDSNIDVVVVLDSSGSMGWMAAGNDGWGQRKKATVRLIGRLSSTDRIAIVDFDHDARVHLPLTRLATADDRRRAREAVRRVDSRGGSFVEAGIAAGVEAARSDRQPDRPVHMIVLTDGENEGDLHLSTDPVAEARAAGITIHTVGLGPQADEALLDSIARRTGGAYYPVGRASELIATFENIFEQDLVMISERPPTATAEPGTASTEPELRLVSHPAWLVVGRVASWALLGLALGLGQGIRENSREDLRACSIGGFLGGMLGGFLFDPVSSTLFSQTPWIGRAVAEVVVGASIGGTMRLFQRQMVERSGKEPTTLFEVLPRRSGLSLGQ